MDNKQKYNPQIHHRRSIRLKGYDYSQQGLYFVTMCVKNRACLFGEIINQQMILNDAGVMVAKWYNELENKYPDIKCHEHMVMPNHFHCIVENTGSVGKTKLHVCPGEEQLPDFVGGGQDANNDHDQPVPGELILGEHPGSPLWRVLQWFKTMSTNEYIRNVKNNNWRRFDDKLWQRNYYEHIIRDERSYLAISEYIISNPKKWDHDSINPRKEK